LSFTFGNNNMKTLVTLILIVTTSHVLAGAKDNALTKKANADLKSLAMAFNTYKTLSGMYPTTEQGIDVLINIPRVAPRPRRWAQLLKKEPLDPWGRSYQYRLEKGKIILWSRGADLKDKKDDIHYVSPKKVAEQVAASDR